MSQPREITSSNGWFGWFFSSDKGNNPEPRDTSQVGYDRMEDSCHVDSHGPPSRFSRTEVTQRSPAADSVYGYGYSTYQMGATSGGDDYDLQLKRKDRNPSVNSVS
ncbi:hypothetical protein ElyMa_004550900 [Elysia marginata]|uniref:Uncharacterized protein n=1 Tax=Elysia marginata TaxID=1093978 RepID=A0AAV4HRU1_9GAST|nr:hypothetical protein ElyMa_004550900 [Elysia marginata]